MRSRSIRVRTILALCTCIALLHAVPVLAVPWIPFGPDGGDARRIVPDPTNHNHLYLGTVNGWIFESSNSGANWHRLARVDKRDDLVLDSIVVDRQNPRHLIVGAFTIGNVDGGMYLSYDAGKSWTSQAEMRGQSVRSLTSAPSNPAILVAGTLKGVFRTTDGGRRWHLISPPDSTEIHEVESVAIDPVDPGIIYAGTWHLPWKTTDGGEHWENIKDGIIEDSDVFSIIVDPQSPTTVYASACSGIYKSENGGTLFHKIQGIPSTARRTRVLMQDPNDLKVVFAGTTEGLWRTDDAGLQWKRLTGPEVIVNDVSIDPSDSKHVLIATDRGGVLASEDGGDSFHSSNGGFSARQITAMYHDTAHPATVLVGVVNDKEWGGVFRSDDGGLSWAQQAQGLQGRDVFALTQTANGTYIAGTAHGLFRWDTDAAAWVRIENTPGGTTASPDAAHLPAIHVRSAVPISRNHYAARPSPHLVAHLAPRRPGARTAVQSSRTGSRLRSRQPASKTAGAHRAVSRAHTPLRTTSRTGAVNPTRRNRPAARRLPVTIAKRTPPQTPPSDRVADANSDSPAQLPAAASGVAADPTLASAPAPPTPTQEPAASTALEHAGGGFSGTVYSLTTVGDRVLAATSLGLLASDDNGSSWTLAGPEHSEQWRFLAAAHDDMVAASLHNLSYSADAGRSWTGILLPEGLTQVGAVAVEPSGRIWVGGREGIFLSQDAGATWTTPKNLFVNTVNSIFFDEASNRMMVTTGSYSGVVFLVQLRTLSVSFADTGWNLRFARPIGDHLIAATLYDGIVVEPRMVDSPVAKSDARSSMPQNTIVAPSRIPIVREPSWPGPWSQRRSCCGKRSPAHRAAVAPASGRVFHTLLSRGHQTSVAPNILPLPYLSLSKPLA